jgi:hypothetical protein
MIKIGFWHSEEEPYLPRPQDYVDTSWSAGRDFIISYLRSGKIIDSYLGWSDCRMCDLENNGASDLSDGTYLWPEGYAHYLEIHAVKPPQDFIDHVMKSKV